MASWREMAIEALADAAPTPATRQSAERVPSELELAIARLESRRPPRLVNPANWAGVVADAKRLVSQGWASRAMALGWSMTDLFGIGPKDSWEFSGLAVWLDGRDVLMLDADRALVARGLNRATFIRGGWGHGRDEGLPPPVLLWDFGRRS